jgi:hypothetical protein
MEVVAQPGLGGPDAAGAWRSWHSQVWGSSYSWRWRQGVLMLALDVEVPLPPQTQKPKMSTYIDWSGAEQMVKRV